MIWTRHRPGFYTSCDYVIERSLQNLEWYPRYEGAAQFRGFIRTSYRRLQEAKRACDEHRRCTTTADESSKGQTHG